VPDIVDQLRAGAELDGTTYRVHLDGHNQLPYLTAETDVSARNFFFYINDDADLVAVRYDNWKMVFLEQRVTGTLQVWAEPFVELRVPKIFNLRTDPFERADFTSNTYWDWLIDHAFLLVPAQMFVAQMASTFLEFPPRQEGATFGIRSALAKLRAGLPSA
jgi:arylsulfatase